MYTVYLDESGHETRDHVVVAGFIGTDDQWARFDADWLAGLKGNTSFPAKSLRWNQDATRKRVSTLSAIPYRYGLKSIVGSVHVPDYADLLHNKAEEYVNQGYVLCLYPILSDVSFKIPETEHVKWVFEEQHDYEQATRDVFKQFAVLYGESRFSDVSFVPAASTTRLQPADLLAYSILQMVRDRKSRKAQFSRPIIGSDPWGSIVPRDIVRGILGPSIDLVNEHEKAQTGIDPRVAFMKYQGKREVHEAIRLEKERRDAAELKTKKYPPPPERKGPIVPERESYPCGCLSSVPASTLRAEAR